MRNSATGVCQVFAASLSWCWRRRPPWPRKARFAGCLLTPTHPPTSPKTSGSTPSLRLSAPRSSTLRGDATFSVRPRRPHLSHRGYRRGTPGAGEPPQRGARRGALHLVLQHQRRPGSLVEWAAYGYGQTGRRRSTPSSRRSTFLRRAGTESSASAPTRRSTPLRTSTGIPSTEYPGYRIAVYLGQANNTQRLGGFYLRWSRQLAPRRDRRRSRTSADGRPGVPVRGSFRDWPSPAVRRRPLLPRQSRHASPDGDLSCQGAWPSLAELIDSDNGSLSRRATEPAAFSFPSRVALESRHEGAPGLRLPFLGGAPAPPGRLGRGEQSAGLRQVQQPATGTGTRTAWK